MNPLKVSLPSFSKRKSQRLNKKGQPPNKSKNTCTARVANWRIQQRKDPEKAVELTKAKQEQNKKYKDKLKHLRKSNIEVDNKVREAQRLWKQRSRANAKARKEKEAQTREKDATNVAEKEPANPPASVDTPVTPNVLNTPASPRTRKRAQRVRAQLPGTPKAWATTMNHIINNATPRRKSILDNSTCRPIVHSAPSSVTTTDMVANTIQMTKVGRPTRQLINIKRQLSFTEGANYALYKNQYTLNRYLKRSEVKIIKTSKPQQHSSKWRLQIIKYLEDNSRVMPNKKDTVLIGGVPVAKRHLLCTKFQAYQDFKKSHPQYDRKYTTFRKSIPRNIRILDQACRRVCICTRDYNIEQKVEALNKTASKLRMEELSTTVKQLSKNTLCEHSGTPTRKCIDRACENCGTDYILDYYQPLIQASQDNHAKYQQWEQGNASYTDKVGKKRTVKKWKQVQKTLEIKELVIKRQPLTSS